MSKHTESWNSRVGVILAVAGSAVGLGNFLRFPGLAAEYGGGAFMLAYFLSFILLGLPICWAEWTIGRLGGVNGFNAAPGILAAVTRKPGFRFLGIIGIIIPVVIYMYYVLIEAWCLNYAVNYLLGNMDFRSASGELDQNMATSYLLNLIGDTEQGNGSAIFNDLNPLQSAVPYVIAVFILNFVLIYRGISKGIEWFCKFAMPLLILTALVVLIRVLTLGTPDASHPERNVFNGLGFMWNPSKVMVQEADGDGNWTNTEQLFSEERIIEFEEKATADENLRVIHISMMDQLKNPSLWLAAAGQIFFSLSVGFGVILTYSSYMKKDDDVVLSGLAASSANEFCEVAIGGLMSVPAGVAFFGTAGIMFALGSSILIGFLVLPMVFTAMGSLGMVFGFMFFFLLFLAAVTSSLSMLQPGIAFLEETMGIGRKQSVVILGIITTMGAAFVLYFSSGTIALDTIDFWVTNLLMVSLALIEIIVFAWIIGLDKALDTAHQGAAIRIPHFMRPILKYVSPIFLIIIFGSWLFGSVFGLTGTTDSKVQMLLDGNNVAWMSVGLIVLIGLFFTFLTIASPRYKLNGKAKS